MYVLDKCAYCGCVPNQDKLRPVDIDSGADDAKIFTFVFGVSYIVELCLVKLLI